MMADERIPNDPYRQTIAGEDPRSEELSNAARLNNRLQPDLALVEGPASGGRLAMLAVGIVVVLGVVFYGLDSSSINQAGSSKTELTTAQNSTTQKQNSTAQNNTQPPAAPPGMRDVTPRANTEPGVTTGSAATRPPPSSPNQSDATQGANPFNHSEQR
jgi:hypothetical protein